MINWLTFSLTFTVTYYEIGRMIVEHEQKGASRAEYGKSVLKKLSKNLTNRFGRGFSVDNLENMRRFYITYSNEVISETPSRESIVQKSETASRIFEPPPTNLQTLSAQFTLSWSHYLFLMRITNDKERKFYENEATNERWSLRELKRQFNAALYERLALSREMYVNYYDRKVKLATENPTVGILLCKEKNNAVVEMTLPEDNTQIFASKYELVLPDKAALMRLLENKFNDEE